jgi:hypothetical protein
MRKIFIGLFFIIARDRNFTRIMTLKSRDSSFYDAIDSDNSFIDDDEFPEFLSFKGDNSEVRILRREVSKLRKQVKKLQKVVILSVFESKEELTQIIKDIW